MILSYKKNIIGDKRSRIRATVTTLHSESHYGKPVIVLSDGKALDLQSWVLQDYKVVKASPEEQALLQKVFGIVERLCLIILKP